MDIVVWVTVGLLMLAGLAGTVVPLLPGTTLILIGVLLQQWLLPDTLAWGAVAALTLLWGLSVVADFGCTMLGTKWLGGGKWGMAGATGGALAGMFMSVPALVLGSIVGAIVAEKWLGRRTTDESLRAGAGAAAGFMLSLLARLACAL
jgi:uncharacterized protein YqgC (DUF456 family)